MSNVKFLYLKTALYANRKERETWGVQDTIEKWFSNFSNWENSRIAVCVRRICTVPVYRSIHYQHV